MIYNINGLPLQSCYLLNGALANNAYDIDGDLVFPLNQSIKVMTYNVGQWYIGGHDNVPANKDADYYNLQYGLISANNPDVLCMCEYTKQFSKTGRTALSLLQNFFPYIHEQGGDSPTATDGRCIASKYPITNYTTHTYAQTGSPRYYDSCTITIGGVEVCFIVTHLNYNVSSMTARVNQLNELITFMQTKNKFVACGDYNTINSRSPDTNEYQAMILPLLNAGFHCANCSSFGFFDTYSDQPNGTYTGCLDNIITSSNIQITDVYVDETKLTDGLNDKVDHMPLIATLQIGG